MGVQLGLFAGIVPGEPPALAEPTPTPEVAEQAPRGQMGLFDAQVQRLRGALEAVARADLLRAVSLLRRLAPESDPVVSTALRRAEQVHGELLRVRSLPAVQRVGATVDLGRQLTADAHPWSTLGRALIASAAAELASGEPVLAGRLLVEAQELERARAVLLAAPGPSSAAALFALADVESALRDRHAARRRYLEALLLDPFDAGLDRVTDEEVRALPYVAEFEVEVDGEPRAWSAPVGLVAGILSRPDEPVATLPMPANVSTERAVLLARARQFVDALSRAGSPEVQRNRDALLEARRSMKRASPPLFAWYLARQVGAP